MANITSVEQWIIDTEVKLRTPMVNLASSHPSSSSLNATQPRKQGKGNGKGGSGGKGGSSQGSSSASSRGGSTGDEHGTPSQGGLSGNCGPRPGTLPPCTYVRRYGPRAGTPCGQTNHPPNTCFKALDDAWYARGNVGTPPRWGTVSSRPSPADIRTHPAYLPAHLRLLAPPTPFLNLQQQQQQLFQQQPQQQQQLFQQQPPQQQQQQQPPWGPGLPPQWGPSTPPCQQQQLNFSTAATAAQTSPAPLWGAPPPLGSIVTPLTQESFLGNIALSPSLPSMYPSTINETTFQCSVSSSSSPPTLDFVHDSGATEIALKDAGTLTPLSPPTQVHGADSSFTIPCTHLSTLPCTIFPSGKVTGLHIPTL
ncbi:unnamed protein product [Closterium sp. NIES-54]